MSARTPWYSHLYSWAFEWDEYRGQRNRRTMLIKRLFRIPVGIDQHGKWKIVRVDLHKMLCADEAECFHTHPSYAIRIVLRNGYVEQLWDRSFVRWPALSVGIVRPSLCHRIAGLMSRKQGRGALTRRASYSLWIRGPICAEVELWGDGWRRHGIDDGHVEAHK